MPVGGPKFGSKTWKEHFLERHLEEALETLAPEDYNPEEVCFFFQYVSFKIVELYCIALFLFR